MAYRIGPHERIDRAVKRIALEQIDGSLAEIDNHGSNVAETVHQVRKNCKKLRGLLRLSRLALGEHYKTENKAIRDAARGLSHLRDAESLIEVFEKLDQHTSAMNRKHFANIHASLELHRQTVVVKQDDPQKCLAVFRKQLIAVKSRVATWPLRKTGMNVLISGWQATYAGAQAAMHEAYAQPTVENFHEWRKLAKYHWYDHRLLQNAWKPVMKCHAAELSRLSELLGDDHDLSRLVEMVTHTLAETLPASSVRRFTQTAIKQQATLRSKAHVLGARIFAEKPKAQTKRIRKYWQAGRI